MDRQTDGQGQILIPPDYRHGGIKKPRKMDKGSVCMVGGERRGGGGGWGGVGVEGEQSIHIHVNSSSSIETSQLGRWSLFTKFFIS